VTAFRDSAVSGPLFPHVSAIGPVDWTRWDRAARHLERALAGAANLEHRIHQLYLPVLFTLVAWTGRAARRPLMVGLQAPQGSGKTTLVTHLLELMPQFDLRGTAVSIDDFYLPRTEQLALSAAHPGNPYLEHRGYPGTHDVGLGARTLSALRQLGPGSVPKSVLVPAYDKSAHGGRGDRRPEREWRRVEGPLDIVILEGWMLGYSPVAEARLADAHMVGPNRALATYSSWHEQLDAFIVLRALDTGYVIDWRVEAEAAMKARGLPGLDRAAIEDYIRRFLPAYATYGGAPAQIPAERRLEIWLDRERRATSAPRRHAY
jgi:pantothenate kinase-related protein Tda10